MLDLLQDHISLSYKTRGWKLNLGKVYSYGSVWLFFRFRTGRQKVKSDESSQYLG